MNIEDIDYNKVPVDATHYATTGNLFYRIVDMKWQWLNLAFSPFWEVSKFSNEENYQRTLPLPKIWSKGSKLTPKGVLFEIRFEVAGWYALIDNPAYIKQHTDEEQKMTTKQFTKADLKTGMILVSRNGGKSMVLLNTTHGDISSGETWFPLTSLREDLTKLSPPVKDYDIVKIYQPNCIGGYLHNVEKWGISPDADLIWERQSEKQSQYNEILKQIEDLKIKAEAFKP